MGNTGSVLSGLLVCRASPNTVLVELPLKEVGERSGGGGRLGWNQNIGHLLWALLVSNATPNARVDVRRTTGK